MLDREPGCSRCPLAPIWTPVQPAPRHGDQFRHHLPGSAPFGLGGADRRAQAEAGAYIRAYFISSASRPSAPIWSASRPIARKPGLCSRRFLRRKCFSPDSATQPCPPRRRTIGRPSTHPCRGSPADHHLSAPSPRIPPPPSPRPRGCPRRHGLLQVHRQLLFEVRKPRSRKPRGRPRLSMEGACLPPIANSRCRFRLRNRPPRRKRDEGALS